MLKLLSISIATVLFASWPFLSYAFDNERFFTKKFSTVEATAPEFYPEHELHQDQFELAPSGRIDKISTETTVNTISANQAKTPQRKNIDLNRKIDTTADAAMNTLYSNLSTTPQLIDECGLSPMTAAEIEVLVGQSAQSHGVDPGLAQAIVWAESRHDQTCNSDQDARGATQIIPRIAPGLGVHETCDPVSNIDGSVRHLKVMLDEFQNPILAVAAYKAGAQAVYHNGGVPPFPETVRYVAAVINHHMGLQMPPTPWACEVSAPNGSGLSDEMVSDVIGARGSLFVKGVMQF